MATIKGAAEVSRFIAAQRKAIANKLLVGAGRAAANVVAEEAKQRSISEEVTSAIKVSVKHRDDRITAKVEVKGRGAYIAPWLEYGTSPHFISVDVSQRNGMSIGRINKRHAEGSLVISGKFVGTTVHHPGARPHPFLRPALDIKERDAIATARAYIAARVTPKGITGPEEPEDSE